MPAGMLSGPNMTSLSSLLLIVDQVLRVCPHLCLQLLFASSLHVASVCRAMNNDTILLSPADFKVQASASGGSHDEPSCYLYLFCFHWFLLPRFFQMFFHTSLLLVLFTSNCHSCSNVFVTVAVICRCGAVGFCSLRQTVCNCFPWRR